MTDHEPASPASAPPPIPCSCNQGRVMYGPSVWSPCAICDGTGDRSKNRNFRDGWNAALAAQPSAPQPQQETRDADRHGDLAVAGQPLDDAGSHIRDNRGHPDGLRTVGAAPQPGDAERLADLLRRRAEVYNPARPTRPYYGDDDIDLLRSLLDAAQSALAESQKRAASFEAQRDEEATRYIIWNAERRRELAESKAEAARLATELADTVTCLNNERAKFSELLAESQAEVARLNSLLLEPTDGDGEHCYYCDKTCNSFAGNPSHWPLLLPVDPKRPGRPIAVCTRCVLDRLRSPTATEEDRSSAADDVERARAVFRDLMQGYQQKHLDTMVHHIAAARAQGERELIARAEGHYWDSLEAHKWIILAHLRALATPEPQEK